MGIAAAAAIRPMTSSLHYQRVRMAAYRVVSDLNRIRELARHDSSNRTVVFQPLVNQYQAAKVADPFRRTNDLLVTLTAAPYQTSIISADFGGDGTLVFDGFGHADSSGTLILAAGEHRFRIQVSVSGDVSLLAN